MPAAIRASAARRRAGGLPSAAPTSSPWTPSRPTPAITSPLIKLDAKEPHGFSQSGIAVRKGKAYTGRIVLAGSPGAVVKVTLIWGKEAADRQTVTIRTLGAAYRKFPLRYTAAPIPTTQRSRSPAQAPAPFTSARSRSCPPTTSKASALK